ncbi:MAG: hypothetical protein ACPL1K_05205, partial [Candidatus Kryptoniota bacterium]
EIDYLEQGAGLIGYAPEQWILDRAMDYFWTKPFSNHSGIHMIAIVDQKIPWSVFDKNGDYKMSFSECDALYTDRNYFDRVGWKYCVFGNEFDDSVWILGRSTVGGNVMGIAMWSIFLYTLMAVITIGEHAGASLVVFLHELGHTIGMIDYDEKGNEKYCDDLGCAMATVTPINILGFAHENINYCEHHWSQINL